MAGAKFPAFVAARTGRGPEPVAIPGDAAAFLAPQPIGLLPLPPNVREGLLRFGLLTMGAVAAMRRDLRLSPRASASGSVAAPGWPGSPPA